MVSWEQEKQQCFGQCAQKGLKSGLITNDQASELVDTRFLETSGSKIAEVHGSCFCCNFNGFADAIHSLMKENTDVIIAEPVGSCTDLSATIMQPLKDKFSDELEILPYKYILSFIPVSKSQTQL